MGNEGTMTAFLWKFAERTFLQFIQFGVMLSLAAFISPSHYGELLMIMAVIVMFTLFVSGGFAMSLVQQIESDKNDFSTLFTFQLAVATLLYGLLIWNSSTFAQLFSIAHAEHIINVLGLLLFIFSLQSIQQAYIMKHQLFKRLFMCTAIASVGAASCYAAMLIIGHTIWAFVVWHVTYQLLLTFLLVITTRFIPKLTLSLASFKQTFHFGWKLTVSNIIDHSFVNVQYIVIGRVFMPATLAFYNRAEQFPSLIVNNVNGTLQSILLPRLAKLQHDPEHMKEAVRDVTAVVMFIVCPILCLLAISAEQMIAVLFHSGWQEVVPFIQLLCLMYALWPLHAIYLTTLNALGRSDLYLKIEIVKKGLTLVALLLAFKFGIFTYLLSLALVSLLAIFINGAPLKQLLNYSFLQQLQDFTMPFLSSILLATLFIFTQFFLSSPVQLILSICISIGCYLYVSKLRKFNGYVKCLQIVQTNYALFSEKLRMRKKGLSNE